MCWVCSFPFLLYRPSFTLYLNRFGEEIRVNSKAMAETRELNKSPAATFLFKYRPIGLSLCLCLHPFVSNRVFLKEMLRANGIAPLPKVSRKRKRPASSHHERDVKPKLDGIANVDDDSDVEEARILEVRVLLVSMPIFTE